MEYILLLIIIGLIISLINKTSSSYNLLKNNINDLHRKLALLTKEKSEKEKIIPKTPIDQVVDQTPITEKLVPLIEDIPKETIPVKKEPVNHESETVSIADTITNPILEDSKKALSREENESVLEHTKSTNTLNKTIWENFKHKNPDIEKFIGENLINKLGILILVLGISYFVKYAIDKDWINEPARVGIGILCGSLVMAIAHKLRKNYGAFSSVLVAGAIAIFYFTIGIAFHNYHLFSQTVAFSIMVIITIFSCLISLSYDRIELAVLSLIGGFAVPFMVSTGSGNYIILFTYIAILNSGILILSYYRKWNLVNVLAFIFTVLLYTGWFFKDINSENPHYIGAFIFALIFYLTFTITNIINNIRTQGVFSKIQLVILTANTFLFYGAGMVIISEYRPELNGLFTAALAILNLIYAWFLYKKFKLDKIAVYMLIGMTLTFITLAIPVQFKGNYITLFWAAEAVLLLWLSQKSSIKSYRFASTIVHILMLLSLVIDWEQKYTNEAVLNIIINPVFATGIFAVISVFTVYYLLKNDTEKISLWKFVFNTKIYRSTIFKIGIILTYFVGLLETIYQATNYIENVYIALSVSVVYHLIFSGIVALFLFRKNTIPSHQLLNVIALSNTILYAFVFSKIVFIEHQEYISSGVQQQISFYLHYVSLTIIIYFGYLVYKTNKAVAVFELFQHKLAIWIFAFLIVFIASLEVSIHGLVLLNSPFTIETLEMHEYFSEFQNNKEGLRKLISNEIINETKLKIIKTGYPVLWGILAFIFLIIGIKKQQKPLRIIALVLLGITILKLFLFDINNVSETGKIIAFILLGILILTISFVYQKIKVLVIDDDKPKENNEKT
jgi:uncharacterized membrane protein